MNFRLGYCDFEPNGRLHSIFREGISLSQHGGFARWRKSIHFVEVAFNDSLDALAFEKKKKYLRHAAEEKLLVGVRLPLYHEPLPPGRPSLLTPVGGPFGGVKQGAEPALTEEILLAHLELARRHGASYVSFALGRPGIFPNRSEVPAYHRALEFTLALSRRLGVTLAVVNGGLPPGLIERALAEPHARLHFDLAAAALEGQDPLATLVQFLPRIEVLTLSQVMPGKTSPQPLTHRGSFNYHEIFEILKKEACPPFLLIRAKPSYRDLNLVFENLLGAQFHPILSRA